MKVEEEREREKGEEKRDSQNKGGKEESADKS